MFGRRAHILPVSEEPRLHHAAPTPPKDPMTILTPDKGVVVPRFGDWDKTNSSSTDNDKGAVVPRFGNWDEMNSSSADNDKGAVVPRFGNWDETKSLSPNNYSHFFKIVRQEKNLTSQVVSNMSIKQNNADRGKQSDQDKYKNLQISSVSHAKDQRSSSELDNPSVYHVKDQRSSRLDTSSIDHVKDQRSSEPNTPLPLYLSEKERENYFNICLPLYEAALKGDWKAAKIIIAQHPEVINMSITKNHETALHIASSTKHVQFVEELVKLMKLSDLELQDKNGNTALCLAAAAGTVRIAEIMVQKNSNLLMIRGNNSMSPLFMAALFGQKDMVSYLYSKSNNLLGEDWTATDRKLLVNACVSANLYDVALKILFHHKKEVALASEQNVLHILARNPSEFSVATQSIFWRLVNTILPGPRIDPVQKKSQALQIVRMVWREIVQLKDDEIWNIIRGPPETIKTKESNQPNEDEPIRYQSRLLFVAAAMGNTNFLVELLRLCPELIWKIDDNKRTIFHVAVLNRQESVYNLLYEIGSLKDLVTSLVDTDENNILHLAAMKPKQKRLTIVSGVALQMQRELLWFKEVETMVNPSLRESKNKEGKTPQDVFTDEHADLLEKGETWMKETSSQCMVVAALIATVMFAAAFTLPGGSNQDNGRPIFKNESAFIVFVITDAVSLFTSAASILMFLAILTARYAESDFLVSLPIKLMTGLLVLFISITTMMIAFSTSFFLLYTKGEKWVFFLVTGLAALPVILFAALQYYLLFDVIRATISSRYLFKPKKHMLY